MFQARFDDFYLTICKEVGGIENLLHSFFDFMYRKTDFFYECDPGDKMGFPPGYSLKLVVSVFQKFQQQHYKRFPKKNPEQFQQKVEKFKEKKAQEQSKQKTLKQKKEQQVNSQIKQQSKPQTNKNQEKVQQKPKQPQKKQVAPVINTYNGGQTQKYTWSQQTREVEVNIEVESTINSKQLTVSIKNDRISIKKKTGQTIIEGQLYEKINASDSVWKIQRNGNKTFINLNLEKAQEKIWNTVFKGDPEIDPSKVHNSKPLNSFDDETQGAIRKIMHEQQRKMQGLPTTQQQKQLQALKKAWDAEGSPFKGQPFDPSKFNLAGSQFNP